MTARCAICRSAPGDHTFADDFGCCTECKEWVSGELPRRAPGGIPPRSGLAFFMRDHVEDSAPIRLLPRVVRDRLLAEHVAVVEEFAVDLPAVALTDPDGDEGRDE